MFQIQFRRYLNTQESVSPVKKILLSCLPDVPTKNFNKPTHLPYQVDDASEDLLKSSLDLKSTNKTTSIINSQLFLINFKRFVSVNSGNKHYSLFSINILALLHRIQRFPYRWSGSFKTSVGITNKYFNLKFKEFPNSNVCKVIPIDVMDEIVFQIDQFWRQKLINNHEYVSSDELANMTECVNVLFNIIEREYKGVDLPLSFWKKLCLLTSSLNTPNLMGKLPFSDQHSEIQKEFLTMNNMKNNKNWTEFINEFRHMERKYHNNKLYAQMFGTLYVDALERIMKTNQYEQDCVKMYARHSKRFNTTKKYALLYAAETQGLTDLKLCIQSSLSSSIAYLKDFSMSIDEYLCEFQKMNLQLDFQENPEMLHEFEFLTLKFPVYTDVNDYIGFTQRVFDKVTDEKLRYLYIHFLLKNISNECSLAEFCDVLTSTMKMGIEKDEIKLSDLNLITKCLNTKKDVFHTLLQNLAKNSDCKLTTFEVYQYLKNDLKRDFTIDDYYCLIKASLFGNEYLTSYYYLGELLVRYGHQFKKNGTWSLPLRIQQDLIDRRLISFYLDPHIEESLKKISTYFLSNEQPLDLDTLKKFLKVPDNIDQELIQSNVRKCYSYHYQYPRYKEHRDAKNLEVVRKLI